MEKVRSRVKRYGKSSSARKTLTPIFFWYTPTFSNIQPCATATLLCISTSPSDLLSTQIINLLLLLVVLPRLSITSYLFHFQNILGLSDNLTKIEQGILVILFPLPMISLSTRSLFHHLHFFFWVFF